MTNHPCTPEERFITGPTEGGCAITGYTGPGGDVVIPGEIAKVKVVEIGSSSFCGHKSVTSVVIPNSVTSFGSDVFYGCSPTFAAIRTDGLREDVLRSGGEYTVHAGSYAHQYAIDNSIRFELL